MSSEIEVLAKMDELLAELSDDSKQRVFNWLIDKHLSEIKDVRKKPIEVNVESAQESEYADFAEFYFTANPDKLSEKALVAGYWYQEVLKQSEFDSQALNSELKNLGHGLSNITDAFNTLINRKPALARQVKKGGTSKQARKKYRITSEGLRVVRNMLEENNRMENENG